MPPSKRSPDPEALLRELAHAGTYPQTLDGAMDAHRDFRAVLVDDDRGRRVLAQILAWGHNMASTFDPDPIEMARMNGERNLALRILATIEYEPQAQPTRASTRSRTRRAAEPQE